MRDRDKELDRQILGVSRPWLLGEVEGALEGELEVRDSDRDSEERLGQWRYGRGDPMMNTQGVQDIPRPKFKSRRFLFPNGLTPGLAPISFPQTL